MKTISVVSPCYNEEGHVVAEVERITAAMDASGYNYELLCVDDCSTDSTLAKLHEIAPRFPRMTVVPFLRNGGHYIVEDLQTNYGSFQTKYRGVASEFPLPISVGEDRGVRRSW